MKLFKSDLKKRYNFFGLFYHRTKQPCRMVLDIKVKIKPPRKPDLVVVMMNPGSSEPVNTMDELSNKFSSTKPDNTQWQIVRLMEKLGYKYARVINLSDIREPKSSKFYEHLKTTGNHTYSIFHETRKEDYQKYFVKNVPVLLAWGVNKKLENLALLALKRLNNARHFGFLKSGSASAYYHPLPRTEVKQKEWLSKMERKFPRKTSTAS